MIYTCGLRPNEGSELKKENINLENGDILITEPKLKKDRLVVMSEDMLDLAREYDKKRSIFAGDNPYFFPSCKGGALTANKINRHFTQCFALSNPTIPKELLPHLRVYDLRHRFTFINDSALSEYLAHLEKKACSISTRNNRLNGIRSFFSYASKVNHNICAFYGEISKIPLKKETKTAIVEYMNEEAMRVLLAQPDQNTKKGVRDGLIMLLMYDTGARIGGIVNISLCDLKIDKTPVVILHEKGSKIHSVPLMKKTVEYLQNYLSIFHRDESFYSKVPLFYTKRLGQIQNIDPSTIRKFIIGYGEEAKKVCPGMPSHVHPHMIRHSRAMHLYQNGMDLTLVSQWLGHSNLETTLIYAHADTEHKRKAIELAQSSHSPLSDTLDARRYTIDDEDILKKLYGLK